MKNFILGILTVVLIGGVGFAFYQLGQKNYFLQKGATDKATTSPKGEEQVVGNDRDEHGCIPSAGYTWCDAKQKCLREWEESCQTSNDNDLIKQALFTKNGWKDSDGITVAVSTNDGKYASGTASSQGGGGYFFAAKVGGVWKIVADGNGVILCSQLTPYPDYPKTLIPECWDQATQKNLKR